MCKKLLLFLLAVFMLAAAGCAAKKLSGEVVSVDGSVLDVRTAEGCRVFVHITPKTRVFSWIEGVNAADFLQKPRAGVTVSVEYSGSNAEVVELTGRLEQSAALGDGNTAEIWQISGGRAYRLKDGAELLRVNTPTGPANVYVSGLESLDDLNAAARTGIIEYYRDMGTLYDESAELERAYSEYKKAPNNFQTFRLGQEIAPTAASGRVMYFLTSVTLPVSGEYYRECRTGAAFDRATGERIPNAALFCCPEDELAERVVKAAGIGDAALEKELAAAFKQERIVFFTENIEVSFPAGALKSQRDDYLLGIGYGALKGILYGWAQPE